MKFKLTLIFPNYSFLFLVFLPIEKYPVCLLLCVVYKILYVRTQYKIFMTDSVHGPAIQGYQR